MRAPSAPQLAPRRPRRRHGLVALLAATAVGVVLTLSAAPVASTEAFATSATPSAVPSAAPSTAPPATRKPTPTPTPSAAPAPKPSGTPKPVETPTVRGTDFDPGEIISDVNFYDANAMNEADVQAFFASQPCTPKDGVPCLADFRDSTESVPAAEPGHCEAYRGAVNESAARIVTKVARACGINPKVLLVLMQKEQSLITSPSEYGYARAMGWGCPDTGPDFSASCDADYFGFQNQVYRSAWQFRQYTLYPLNVPGESYQRAYHLGKVYIQYNPDTACGGSEVDITNQATANLYLYTPYQPNAAALTNVSGTGDACSAYGNRNFWRLYTEWFGPAV